MKKTILLLLIILTAANALFAGGSSEKKESSSGKTAWITKDSEDAILPGINPLKVSGDIVTAGSSTVFPLSERMAERFRAEGYGGSITIDSIGSGAGFERFCIAGETDIANASRPMKATEAEKARAIGRIPVEFKVGTDAVAVVVSKNNSFIQEATKDELKKIFSVAKKWSDVRSSWPEKDIERFIPGTDSGTFDFFVETIFKKDNKPMLNAANLQMSEDDNVLVQGIEGSPYAVGFFGYSYYKENMDKLNILKIDGVEASDKTVDNGSYLLSRPLFLYTSENILKEKPQVAAFIAYYLTYVNEEIASVGYFPAAKDVLSASKMKWMEIMSESLKK